MFNSYGYGLLPTISGLTSAGFIIAGILFWLFYASIRWKIFVKAGEQGWKSIIPYYSDYIGYKLVWETKWFWFSLLGYVAVVLWMVPIIGPTICIAGIIFLSLLRVVYAMQLAKAFGQDNGFALGLMVFNLIFRFILAYSRDMVYRGPQSAPAFFNNMQESIKSHSQNSNKNNGTQGGQPVYGQPNGAPQGYDPQTGRPVYGQPNGAPQGYDPQTGRPIYGQPNGAPQGYDPQTGQPVYNQQNAAPAGYDPQTGKPVYSQPNVQQPAQQASGQPQSPQDQPNQPNT